jgi:hypothetical protein
MAMIQFSRTGEIVLKLTILEALALNQAICEVIGDKLTLNQIECLIKAWRTLLAALRTSKPHAKALRAISEAKPEPDRYRAAELTTEEMLDELRDRGVKLEEKEDDIPF